MLVSALDLEGAKAMKDAVALARRHAVRGDAHMAEGRDRHAWAVMADAAKPARADLIVVGTYSRRGLNCPHMARAAERVLRERPVPALFERGIHAADVPATETVGKRLSQ
jgi:nucleotide-binding universal stress UspA family protein